MVKVAFARLWCIAAWDGSRSFDDDRIGGRDVWIEQSVANHNAFLLDLAIIKVNSGWTHHSILMDMAVPCIWLSDWLHCHPFSWNMAMIHSVCLTWNVIQYDCLLTWCKWLLCYVPSIVQWFELSSLLVGGNVADSRGVMRREMRCNLMVKGSWSCNFRIQRNYLNDIPFPIRMHPYKSIVIFNLRSLLLYSFSSFLFGTAVGLHQRGIIVLKLLIDGMVLWLLSWLVLVQIDGDVMFVPLRWDLAAEVVALVRFEVF